MQGSLTIFLIWETMPTLSSFTILPNAPGLAGKVRFTMTHCKGKPIKKKKNKQGEI